MDVAILTLWDAECWRWSRTRKDNFIRSCNKFRKEILDYLSLRMNENHSHYGITYKFYKSAQYANIDSTADKPQEVEQALAGVPWGYRKYDGDTQSQAALQQEWEEYIQDDIQAMDDEDTEFKNGKRCLDYWSNQNESWPLLSTIMKRILMCTVSTAAVERSFSRYNYYFSRLDAASLSALHKKNKAWLLANRSFL